MDSKQRKDLERFLETQFKGTYLRHEPLARHTWYRIGGPADIVAYPAGIEDLQRLLQCCRALDVPTYMLGEGANLLISDSGYRGVMIALTRYFTAMQTEDEQVTVMAGALLKDLIEFCERQNLGGLQGLAGIPGTLGGVLTMNAGTNLGEIGDCVRKVKLLNAQLELTELGRNQITFGYRNAPELQNTYILDCTLKLSYDDKDRLRQFRLQQIAKREAKQPLDCPSCGSVFKRPAGFYVGKMVEELGLKGLRHGDAMISEKHGGFIVNCGNATAAQVLYLIRTIQQAVEKRYHVELEPEIRLVGF